MRPGPRADHIRAPVSVGFKSRRTTLPGAGGRGAEGPGPLRLLWWSEATLVHSEATLAPEMLPKQAPQQKDTNVAACPPGENECAQLGAVLAVIFVIRVDSIGQFPVALGLG